MTNNIARKTMFRLASILLADVFQNDYQKLTDKFGKLFSKWTALESTGIHI